MFKILSLDGGGVRGAFSAACLATLESKLDHPLLDYFDLVTATSTGSIIAVLAAAGHSMDEIEKFYSEKSSKIFTRNRPYFGGPYKPINWATTPFLELFAGVSTEELIQPKYTAREFRKIAYDLLHDIEMRDLTSCRLNITAVDLKQGKPTVFKTPHLPNLVRDYKRKAIDILLAATAAPTYFPPVEIEKGTAFCDGGLWANNPSVVGCSEAAHIMNLKENKKLHFSSNILILSIGTGFSKNAYHPPLEHAGVKWWARRILEVMFESQSQSICFYLQRLLADNFYRIDFELPNLSWAALDIVDHVEEMIELGRKKGDEQFEKLKNKFFNSTTEKYIDYPPGI